jgi:hypothetical protein
MLAITTVIMLVYKITFVKNSINSCRVINKYPQFDGHVVYESHNNRLIYALIKAENEPQALQDAERLITEYVQRNEA